MLARLQKFLGRTRRDRSGNVAVIVALATIPLLGLGGLAIDYGMVLATKAKLDQAADAAALASVTGTQTYLQTYTGSSDVTNSAEAAGQAQGTSQFLANSGRLPNGTLASPTVQVTRNGPTLTGRVTYAFTMPTLFMAALGSKTITVTGNSTSTLTMPTYINVYVVLDVSSSMGIGATQADQQTVFNATGCAVACHYDGSETTAHNKGATLRIDVAKSAIAAGLAKIPTGSTYQVAVYTMSDNLVQVYAPSNNVTGAITAVQGIDLAGDNYDGGTDTTNALKSLAKTLPATGNGLTASTALGVVMFISDAVQDSDEKVCGGRNCSSQTDTSSSTFTVLNPCSSGTSTPTSGDCWMDRNFGVYFESIDPSQCSAVVSAGYTLMTLDVQYLIPPANLQGNSSTLQQAFSYIQNRLIGTIQNNMSQCASSPSYAYSANTPDEIAAATTAMFGAIPTVSSARLSQ